MNFDQLNEYARRVARLLFGQFPEWARLARVDARPNVDSGALLLEVEAPSRNAEGGLYIGTDGDELTIGFHTHHCHFADYEQSGTDKQIENGVEYIRKILSEEFVIYSWYRGGQFCGSATGTVDSICEPSQFLGVVDKITRRSWAGTYDADNLKITGWHG